jgi:hypothetical protein
MVCIIVNVARWKEDPEWYNMKYMLYVRTEWRRYKRALIKRRETLKTDLKKPFYDEQINKCNENLLKVQQVITNLNQI